MVQSTRYWALLLALLMAVAINAQQQEPVRQRRAPSEGLAARAAQRQAEPKFKRQEISSSSSSSISSSPVVVNSAAPSPSTITVTVTVSASNASATQKPASYNCASGGCANFGICSGSGPCVCPAGFGGDDCSSATCGSLNKSPTSRPLRSSGSSCNCDSGFGGINCNVCTQPNACQASSLTSSAGTFLTNDSPTCSQSPRTYIASYGDCQVIDPTLQAIYHGSTHITYSKNISSSETLAQLWYNDAEQFYCKASNCSQTLPQGGSNSSEVDWHCETITCKCISNTTICGGGPGSIIPLAGTINAISGSLDLNCDGGGDGKCNFKASALAGLFPNGLSLQSCSFGECVDQSVIDAAASSSGMFGSHLALSSGVIAGLAVLGAFILALLAICLFACLGRRARRRRGGEIGKQGVNVEFRNIGYTARMHSGAVFSKSKTEKALLHSVDGHVKKGQLLGILGPSGAGKSTLVDILAGKSKSGKITGEMRVDGRRVRASELRRLVGFVDQEDVLPSTQTIREALVFSAQLKLPESVTMAEKNKRVDEVLELLRLEHVADQRIGSITTRGISGGEKRRLSIGLELLAAPAILVLDEPTSGLDSVSAKNVIEQLRTLSRSKYKTTIIMTIHQPRADVYSILDKVLLLAEGKELYSGDGQKAEAYFDKKGIKCPAHYNIADHLLDIASTKEIVQKLDKPAGEKSSSESVKSRSSTSSKKGGTSGATILSTAANEDEEEKIPDTSPVERTSKGDAPIYAASFLTQFEALAVREWRNLLRSKSLFLAHFLIACALGAFVGGLYYKTDESLGGFQNRLGAMFFMLALFGFSSLSALGSLSGKRGLFLRERSNNFYPPLPFVMTHLLFDLLPLRIIPSLILSTMIYWMVGFANTAGQFFKFWLVVILFQLSTALFCMNVAAIFEETSVASLFASIIMLFSLLFGGFILNLGQITPVLSWIQYLSPFKYALEALAVNEVTNLRIVDTLQGVSINVPAVLILQKLFGFQDRYYEDVLLVCVFIIVFTVVLVGLIQWRLRERK